MLLITTGGLYWGLFIGLVGMFFFIFGKKRSEITTIITGLILMVYPYFISSLGWNIAIGITIVIVYIFLKRIID